jgi:hypothetical protein
MDLKEINEICKDRELVTTEMYSPNDFYGHATILKDYCGIPNQYSIKAAIEHAPTLGDFAWSTDLNAPSPSMFCFSRARFKTLRKYTKKALFAIGSPIQYAQSLLSESEKLKERQRLGNSLLVFPSHSSHHVAVNYDLHSYCQRIQALSKNFDSTRICLYWKDALDGAAKIYQSYGFECTSAGHMFDPLFLRRLRSIIESASVTTAPDGGTIVGYSIALNVPFFLTETRISYDSKTLENVQELKKNVDQSTVFYNRVQAAFGDTPTTEITTEARALVNELWGLPSKKTPEEMKNFISIAEDLFSLGISANSFNENYLHLMLSEYIKNSDSAKALLAIDELENSDPDQSSELPLVRAATLLQLGRSAAAKLTLEQLLEQKPGHAGALRLLALCN